MPRATRRQAWLVLPLHHEPPPLANACFRRATARGFVLYRVEGERGKSASYMESRLDKHGYVRLYEHFYFPSMDCVPDHERLVRCFFDWISPKYDGLNTKGKNAACYDFLFKYARIDPLLAPRVLDFGCGSGAIVDSGVPAVADVLRGYDLSTGMGSMAKSKGMKVLTRQEFLTLPRACIDLIMCSYVLHYGIAKRELSHLLSILAQDGVLVGNIHKNLRIEELYRQLDGLPRDQYATHWARTPFGRCVRIKKLTIAARSD